jgi:hypothetical protein
MEDLKQFEVKDGQIIVPYNAKNGTRVLVRVSNIDHASDGQVNLLRMWLRLIEEQTGHNWRKIYDQSCWAVGIDKDVKKLNSDEIKLILQDLESLAAEEELKLPFPTNWSRRNKLYGI